MGTVIQNRLQSRSTAIPVSSCTKSLRLGLPQQQREEFERLWNSELLKAEIHYKQQLEKIFLQLSITTASTPSLQPDHLVSNFVSCKSESEINDLFNLASTLKQDTEATTKNLIEAVKMWEQYHSSNISQNLFVHLFSQKFYCDSSLGLILSSLRNHYQKLEFTSSNIDSFLNNNNINNNINNNSHYSNLQQYDAHFLALCHEVQSLRQITSKIPLQLVSHVVAHRGFHYSQAKLERPLENTLQAFETAWSSGVHNCECDIFLTKDNELIIFHDTTLQRLTLFPKSENSLKHITQLTFEEIVSTPLKNGVRCPLLKEVLESSRRLSPNSKLVIEIKQESPNVSYELSNFLISNPDYLHRVPVVMSFVIDELSKFIYFFNEKKKNLNNETLKLISKPKIMLLTCCIGTAEFPHEIEVGIDDVDKIISLINNKGNEFSFDGIYLQFDERMIGSHKDVLINLCNNYTIGVWDCRPDNLLTASILQQMGVQFINTDLPLSYFSE